MSPDTDAKGTDSSRDRRTIVGYLLSGAVQLVLCALGTIFFISERVDDRRGLLLLWCLVASGYAVVAVIVLLARTRRADQASNTPPHLEVSRWARVISLFSTIGASLIGAGAAILVLGLRSSQPASTPVAIVGVWAMILSWGLLHWGFTQLYYQKYYASQQPTMRFPTTAHPGLIEFAYFSFTMGTSFAASDVDVQTSDVRLLVMWHSILSFFFNGLIIVFALNTILSSN